MKAIQVQKHGGPEVLALVDLPIPQAKPEQVVIKVAAAGVNFIDTYFREGRYPAQPPFIVGQECAGVVHQAGSATSTWKPGDRVAYTGTLAGCYAEYTAVTADRLVRIPDGVTEKQAAAAMLQGMTAHYLIYSCYPVKKGDQVLVHAAAGGMGLLLVQLAKQAGARVIGTVSTEEKAELARGAGADDIILYTQQDFEAETKRLTGGAGVHVIYDGVGKTTFDKGLNVLRPRGYMVLYGGASGAVAPFDPIILSQKGSLFLTRPTLAHYIAARAELEQRSSDLFRWIAEGKLNLHIGHVYPLRDAAQAQGDLESRKTTGKLLLIP
jgi:NADPH2:quinone reductase